MERLRLREAMTYVALIGVLMLGLAGLRWSHAADTIAQPVAPMQPSTLPQPVPPPPPLLPPSNPPPLPPVTQSITLIATIDDVPGVTAHVYVVQGQVIVVSNVGVAMQTDLSPSPTAATTSPTATTTTTR